VICKSHNLFVPSKFQFQFVLFNAHTLNSALNRVRCGQYHAIFATVHLRQPNLHHFHICRLERLLEISFMNLSASLINLKLMWINLTEYSIHIFIRNADNLYNYTKLLQSRRQNFTSEIPEIDNQCIIIQRDLNDMRWIYWR
jgi:hypothetical protein